MYRMLICLIFTISIGCSATSSQQPVKPITREQAFGLDGKPGPRDEDATVVPTRRPFSEDNVKLCLQLARAQAQSADELADCILASDLPLRERIQKAQAAAQKADEKMETRPEFLERMDQTQGQEIVDPTVKRRRAIPQPPSP
ncbi:MAG: hypothetical protein PHC53_01295 [Patescibacteria group bacterium]|nr:hypothetical protein [Patescibacteria group bacterium]